MPDANEKIETEGVVDRIVFHNEENGFTVIRLKTEKSLPVINDNVVNCTGYMLHPKEEQKIKISGKWVKHNRFGWQINFDFYENPLPESKLDLHNYLANGGIKGIGPGLAKRILEAFGEKTLQVLDEEPDRLLTIRGIGPNSLERICESWNNQDNRKERKLMIVLQSEDISPAYAKKIIKTYGQEAIDIIQNQPYRLAKDVQGIGFLKADAIAARHDFAPDDPRRIAEGLIYTLQKSMDDGHVFLPENYLYENSTTILQKARPMNDKSLQNLPNLRAKSIEQLLQEDRIVVEESIDKTGHDIYLTALYICETKIASFIKRLLQTPSSVKVNLTSQIIQQFSQNLEIRLTEEQIKAVQMATTCKVLILTGGPGTGKTTIIKAMIRTFETENARIKLAAPTGRAAKRMAESSGLPASTIHRLLEYSINEDRFLRNDGNPLQCDLLIVDEASMLDTMLFYHLLKAVPPACTLVLVGDVHQLPSVGAGRILGDLIESGIIPVERLTNIFRQASGSGIIVNAHRINHGQMPYFENNKEQMSDFYFFTQAEAEDTADTIIDLVRFYVPQRFGLNPLEDIQVLSPMRRGVIGTNMLNARLQEALNPQKSELRRGDRAFRLRDKVMQIKNNYDKDIFNGDIGQIAYINLNQRELMVNFDGRIVSYSFEELDELVLAYTISVHKSQGSEYPAVIIPVRNEHYILLQRNLIYTGVTRGKKLVILVGEIEALRIALANNRTRKRWTRLKLRLQQKDKI